MRIKKCLGDCQLPSGAVAPACDSCSRHVWSQTINGHCGHWHLCRECLKAYMAIATVNFMSRDLEKAFVALDVRQFDES